jgi:hypothetical protein
MPLLMQNYEPPPPPTSFDLIDLALKAGKLDAETALEYKTFAEFDDARLPAAYQASQAGGEAGLFMNEVVVAYPSLSAAAKTVLEPFFIPPFQAGSWMAQTGYSLAASAPADWAFISAAGGKARVWYKQADPEMQRKAGVIAAALTTDIWPKETTLMGRTPVLDSAGVQNVVVYDHYRSSWNGTFVPFGIYAGMTVPQTCSQTASILYINSNLPDTSGVRSAGTKIGLIETTAHEFMHALQFAFPLAVNPCTEYGWLAEATATWAEDFVYPDHDTEWRLAKNYLNEPGLEINDRFQWRDYGEYLLVYFFTHKYNNPQAVRSAWLAAGHMDSLMSFMTLGDMNADQVVSLWNKEPFGTFFKDNDTLDYHVKPDFDGTLKTAGGFQEYSLMDDLNSGELRVYHYMVDPSVRTITILNGLTTKITAGPDNGNAEDTVYNQSDVSYDDMRGAEVVTLVKFSGMDPWQLVNAGRQDFCQDWLKQRVSEILVFMTNQDMTDRNRVLSATGEQTKILVSSVPCMKLVGTASKTEKFANVTETLSASVQYVHVAYDPSWSPYVDILSPEIEMVLNSGSVSWNIGGTDSNGCSYSGSNVFSLTKANNPSQLILQFDLLPGSHHFLGYDGTGSTDDPPPEVSYTVSCPDYPTQTFKEVVGYFFMPDGTIPVKPDGSLQGDVTIDEGGGISLRFVWNLLPAAQ